MVLLCLPTPDTSGGLCWRPGVNPVANHLCFILSDFPFSVGGIDLLAIR